MGIDYGIIGRRIKEKRRLRALTQEKLAEALGVSVGYVSQIERGITHVNLDTLSNIAAELNCDVTELISNITVGTAPFLSTELSDIFNGMDNTKRKMLLEIAQIIKNS